MTVAARAVGCHARLAREVSFLARAAGQSSFQSRSILRIGMTGIALRAVMALWTGHVSQAPSAAVVPICARGTLPGCGGTVLEAPAFVADLSIARESVGERGGYLCVAEDGWPFTKRQSQVARSRIKVSLTPPSIGLKPMARFGTTLEVERADFLGHR